MSGDAYFQACSGIEIQRLPGNWATVVFHRAKEAHQKRLDDGQLTSDTPALTAAALRENGEAAGSKRGVSFHGNKHAPGFFDKTTDDVYLMFLEAKEQREVTNMLDN